MYFRICQEADRIRFEISSEKRAIELAHETCLGFLTDHGARNAVPVYVVLDELLKNAMKHGNGCDPGRHIQCSLSAVSGGLFELSVSDEGAGFAYEELDTTLPDDPRTVTRRGLIVARALSESLEFSDGGRCVTAKIPVTESTASDGANGSALGGLWGPAMNGEEQARRNGTVC
ncbi:MAG: ATP-binding protein [bacterium]|nr:ATP-binding protein [bacterium]